MLQYYTELINIISIPIVTIILIWTLVIFHKNRKNWSCYDIPVVAILSQSIIRNLAVLIFTVLSATEIHLHFDYCSTGVWLFNTLQTFQATCLATLSIIGLFSVKLNQKQQNLKQFLTSTHIIYHLFCLTTLCACVGVAAILAQPDKDQNHHENNEKIDDNNENIGKSGVICEFLPYELDVKFYVFVLALHVFLSVISVGAFLLICYHYLIIKKKKKKRCYDSQNNIKHSSSLNLNLKSKSTSDLSDLSLGLSTIANPHENLTGKHNYFDTYTIACRNNQDQEEGCFGRNNHQGEYCGVNNERNGMIKSPIWTSSDISTTVSSTNSRRPCLGRRTTTTNLLGGGGGGRGGLIEGNDDDYEDCTTTTTFNINNLTSTLNGIGGGNGSGTGMETVCPVLIVSYLFNHFPVIALCIFPSFINPLPVATVALWLGLLQDILIPTSLIIIDPRFTKWVSKVYRCSERRREMDEKLPHGPEGKFRPFGSQPQSLETPPQIHLQNHHNQLVLSPPPTNSQRQQEVTNATAKFPITNGSLYTSIDGRLPIIHNYRRNQRGKQEGHILNLGLHATHLQRKEFFHNNNQQQHLHNNQENSSSSCSCNNCICTENKSSSNNHNFGNKITQQQILLLGNLLEERDINNQSKNHQQHQQQQRRLSLMRSPSYSVQNLLEISEEKSDSFKFLGHLNDDNNDSRIDREKKRRLSSRLSRSEDSLITNKKYKDNKENINFKIKHKYGSSDLTLRQEDSLNYNLSSDDEEDDEEYFTDSVNNSHLRRNRNSSDLNLNLSNSNDFNTLSSDSSYSITTEANCDFDFYQNDQNQNVNTTNNENVTFSSSKNFQQAYNFNNNNNMLLDNEVSFKPPVLRTFKPNLFIEQQQKLHLLNRSPSKTSSSDQIQTTNPNLNFRITRSNSKRSLENLQNYVEENEQQQHFFAEFINNSKLGRSNSFMIISDRNNVRKLKNKSTNRNQSSSNSNKNNVHHKSMESFYNDISYMENGAAINRNINHPNYLLQQQTRNLNHNSSSCYYGGSVPDFKKIFISDYL